MDNANGEPPQEWGEGKEAAPAPAEGSIGGYESLHRLLESNLSPQLFKEASLLLLGLNCVRPLEAISLAEDTIALAEKHNFDVQLGRQEDAHEFLRFVVDACRTAGLRIRKCLHDTSANGERSQEEGWGQGSYMVKETFGGALLSQVKCIVCKGESNKTDDIMDINLDLHGSSSVGEALTRFFRLRYWRAQTSIVVKGNIK